MIRIDHINIVVPDIERAIQFYCAIFELQRGFETTLEGEWIDRVTGISGALARCVFLECGGETRVELLQYLRPSGEIIEANAQPNTCGLRHLAFTVDDLDALVGRLKAHNIKLVSEPVEVPFAVGNLGRKRLCYFHDPDGVLLEVAAYSK